MGSPLYYSHDIAPPRHDPATVRATAGALAVMRADGPGQWTDNLWEMAQRNRGAIYTTAKAIRNTIAGATVMAVKDRPARTTFGPGGTVAKSQPSTGAGARDQDYIPAPNDHPLSMLIERPNENETIGDVLDYFTLQHLIFGDALLWTVPEATGYEKGVIRACELYALPTALTQPQPAGSEQYPSGYYRLMNYYPGGGMGYFAGRAGRVAGTTATLDKREVARFKDAHVLYRWAGFSPLTACAKPFDLVEAIDESRWAAMQHGVTPDMLITGGGVDEQSGKELASAITQGHGGSRNARKVLTAFTNNPDAKFTVQQLSTSAKEMDYVNSWDQAVGFLLSAYGVPKSVAGLATATSYSELYAALRQFYALTMRPYAVRLGAFLTRALARPWSRKPGEYRVQIDLPNQDEPELPKEQLGRQLQYDLLTYNQALARDNLPPVPNGDVPVSVYLKLLEAKLTPKPEPVTPELAAGMGGPPNKGKGPTAGAVPTPDNDAAEGTGVPVAKAMAEEYADPAPYGYCPECRTPGVVAERRIDGNAHCANGHAYPRKKAKYASTQVELTGAARRKLLALAAKVADADLGEDGRESESHVTVRYGLHADGPAQVAEIVRGFGPVRLTLGGLDAFRGAATGKDYDVIFARVDSPDLHRLNALLKQLPNTETWADYKPHATVAYVKAGLADKYLAALGPVDESQTARTLTFSTAARDHTDIPLAGVVKGMHTLEDSAGGFLATGKRRRRVKIKGERADAVMKRIVAEASK